MSSLNSSSPSSETSEPQAAPAARKPGFGWLSYGSFGSILVLGAWIVIRWLPADTNAEQVLLPGINENGAASSEVIQPRPESNAPKKLTAAELAKLPLPDRISQRVIDQAEHPFDPLLIVARTCLETIDRDIRDYSATLISQVRVKGELMPPRKLACKIRHPSDDPSDLVPFSVYTRFKEPTRIAGQEAIWVEGWNEGNLVAHLTGLANVKRFYLAPESSYAMEGNRYPIYEIGFRNLLAKMVEVGLRDREHGECQVTVKKNLEIDGRPCTMLEVQHPVKRDHFEFHIARIYIDDEREFPLGYEGYLWPKEEGGEPELLEKYFYTEVQTNVGLQDIDFDPANEKYSFPSW